MSVKIFLSIGRHDNDTIPNKQTFPVIWKL